MTGQYTLTKEEEQVVRKLIEKYITSYSGDLYKDNDVSIKFANSDEHGEEVKEDWAYVQIN